MITEIIDATYDFQGHQINHPSKNINKLWHPTFKMEFYATCKVENKFNSIEELRKFLMTCSYKSDKEQFDKDDYWMPPNDFEKSRLGDCDDFALYTWRQFIEMGYKSRYTIGLGGRYEIGHAWVTLSIGGKNFFVEPLARKVKKLPRFFQLRYKPDISAEFIENKMIYYKHKIPNYYPTLKDIVYYGVEWLLFYASLIPKSIYYLTLNVSKKIFNKNKPHKK